MAELAALRQEEAAAGALRELLEERPLPEHW
jgi:hypothetical protein